jgi:flagellar motor switch protein FliM
MNLAIPSIFIKRLRHKFEQLQNVRKTHAQVDPTKMGKLLQEVQLDFTAVLDGGSVTTKTLLDLKPGDVLVFDHPTDRPVKGSLNHRDKWSGMIAAHRGKLLFEVSELTPPEAK